LTVFECFGTNRGVLERRLWLIWVGSKDTAQAII
jgi:hypothetical protein